MMELVAQLSGASAATRIGVAQQGLLRRLASLMPQLSRYSVVSVVALAAGESMAGGAWTGGSVSCGALCAAAAVSPVARSPTAIAPSKIRFMTDLRGWK